MAKMIFSKLGNKKEEAVSAIDKLQENHNLHVKKLKDEYEEKFKQLKEKSIEDMNYKPSKLDFHQVLQHAFNEETGCLKVQGNLKFENSESGNQLAINKDGSLNIKLHEEDRELLRTVAANNDSEKYKYLEKKLSYARSMNVVLYFSMFFLAAIIYFHRSV